MKIATLLLAVTILIAPNTLFSNPPQSGDVPAEVNAARSALKGAYSDLEHAGGDWGGHRQKAMDHISEAQNELNQAEVWARQHHQIK